MLRVKKQTLLLVAGIVWLIAGFNVARLGVLAYVTRVSVQNIFLSIAIFALFGTMFYKMFQKHSKRILSYEEEKVSVFRFFDKKAYCIMAFMMSGGIALRAWHLLPEWVVAFFYTGLGLALGVAGIAFTAKYRKQRKQC